MVILFLLSVTVLRKNSKLSEIFTFHSDYTILKGPSSFATSKVYEVVPVDMRTVNPLSVSRTPGPSKDRRPRSTTVTDYEPRTLSEKTTVSRCRLTGRLVIMSGVYGR